MEAGYGASKQQERYQKLHGFMLIPDMQRTPVNSDHQESVVRSTRSHEHPRRQLPVGNSCQLAPPASTSRNHSRHVSCLDLKPCAFLLAEPVCFSRFLQFLDGRASSAGFQEGCTVALLPPPRPPPHIADCDHPPNTTSARLPWRPPAAGGQRGLP